MSYALTIICDRKLPGGELCGQRRTTAIGPGITMGAAMVGAHQDATEAGWIPLREGGWACPAEHVSREAGGAAPTSRRAMLRPFDA